MNHRFETPDLLKGIAVILMIQVHITELFIDASFVNTQIGKFSLFLGSVPAAPLFMVVMGFFAIYLQKSCLWGIKRGLKLMLWGFLLNIGMNLHLLVNILFNHWNYDPLPYLFGVDILFLGGMSLIVISLLNRLFNRNALAFAFSSILAVSLVHIVPVYEGPSGIIRYVLGFIISHEGWSFFPLFPWVAYSLAGASAGILYNRYKIRINALKSYLLFIPSGIVIALWNYGYNISADLPAYYHHGIKFFIWAIMLILLMVVSGYLFQITVSENNNLRKYLLWTGRNVTAFYVFQWIIIGNIATTVYKSQSALMLPIWFVGIVSITSALVFTWNRIKHRFPSIPYLNGV